MTGANLRRRIEAITTHGGAKKLHADAGGMSDLASWVSNWIFDRLGLKLKKGRVEMFVIESAEKPSEN